VQLSEIEVWIVRSSTCLLEGIIYMYDVICCGGEQKCECLVNVNAGKVNVNNLMHEGYGTLYTVLQAVVS
jgi:hypothetical protein